MMRKRRGFAVKKGVAYMQILLMICASFAFAFLIEGERVSAFDVSTMTLSGGDGLGLPTTPSAMSTYGRGGDFWGVGKDAASGTTSEGFSITKGVGNVASGKATFGFTNPTTAGVAGSLAQGLFWGALM